MDSPYANGRVGSTECWSWMRSGPVLKKFRNGTHRISSPDETLPRLEKIQKAAGITRVANITGLDYLGIPVAVAIRPGSRSVSVSQGKGSELAQAMVSAVMEAIETFHAEDIGGRCIRASFRDLSRNCYVVNPKIFSRTSRPYDHTKSLPWIASYNLISHETSWIPYELVHTDYRVPLAADTGYFVVSTNGLGAGNHIAEAVVAALCEVIERDAVALWHGSARTAKARARLDLETIDDPSCVALISKFRAAKMELRAWDVTSDIGIPAFLCDLRENRHNPSSSVGVVQGSGCHPARSVALCRAMTEVAQARLTLISGARDDLGMEYYEDNEIGEIGALLLDIDEGRAARRKFQEIPTLHNDDLAVDLHAILSGLSRAGLDDVMAVDLTRADLGVPVVRVVVPGLEGPFNHPDYKPGRRARRGVLTLR